MSEPQQDVPVTVIPQSVSKPFLRQSRADLIVLVILGIYVFVAVFRGGFWGMLLSIPVSAYLIWPLDFGKRYYVYWENLVVSWWIRVVLEGYLYENVNHPDYVPRPVAWWRRALKFCIRLRHAFPFRVDWVGNVGLIHHIFNKTDTIGIEGDGSVIGALSLVEQDNRIRIIADEIQRIALTKGLGAKVTTSIMRRPFDKIKDAERVSMSYLPDVFLPEARVVLDDFIASLPAMTIEDWHIAVRKEGDRLFKAKEISKKELVHLRRHLTLLEEKVAVAEYCSAVPMTMLITLRRSARLAAAARAKGGKPIAPGEVLRQDVVRLARLFCQQLEVAGVGSPRILNRQGAEDHLATALYVATLDDYRERALNERTGEVKPDPNLPVYHPQVSIRVSNDTFVIDGTGHAILHGVAGPDGGVITPSLMPSMFKKLGSVRYPTRTTIGEPNTDKFEYTGTTLLGRLLEDLLSFFKIRTGAKTENRQIGLEQRERDLAARKHVVYVYPSQAVSGTTPEEIEDGIDATHNVNKGSHVTTVRVVGEARMARFAYETLVGIPD